MRTGFDDTERAGLRDHQRRFLWAPWTVILLGGWQLFAPAVLGHRSEHLWTVPSGGRGPWYADGTLDALRADLMTWSDVASGVLLIVFGLLAVRPERFAAKWATCAVGVWLVCSPIAFWAPTSASFINATTVGMAVVALAVVIPDTPEAPIRTVRGDPTPPGWTFNPSSWPQRGLLIGFALVGLVVSRYLAAYQLGYIDTVWDPLFGSLAGSQTVLDSEVSHAFPVSDAGLGAIVYTFELLVAFIGGTARWRTAPYVVAAFGILVIPLGATHTLLFVAMPLAVQAWCALCFLAGIVALPMIALAVNEVAATLQHLRASRRRGDRGGSLWRVFWLGGSAEGCTPDRRSPDPADMSARPLASVASGAIGVSWPPTLLAALALGIWLYVAPGVFGEETGGAAASVAHVGGAFAVVVASVALAEAIRPLRLVLVPAGALTAAAVWFTGAGLGYSATVFATGVAVAVLALPRGTVRERYGGWDAVVRWPTG